MNPTFQQLLNYALAALTLGCGKSSSEADVSPSYETFFDDEKRPIRKLTKKLPTPLHPSEAFSHLRDDDPYTQPRPARKRAGVKKVDICYPGLLHDREIIDRDGDLAVRIVHAREERQDNPARYYELIAEARVRAMTDKPLPDTPPPPRYSSQPTGSEFTIDSSNSGRSLRPSRATGTQRVPLFVNRPVDPNYQRTKASAAKGVPVRISPNNTYALPPGYSTRKPTMRCAKNLPIGPASRTTPRIPSAAPYRTESLPSIQQPKDAYLNSRSRSSSTRHRPPKMYDMGTDSSHRTAPKPRGILKGSSNSSCQSSHTSWDLGSSESDSSFSGSDFASTAATSLHSTAASLKPPTWNATFDPARSKYRPNGRDVPQRNPSLTDVSKSTEDLVRILDIFPSSPTSSVYGTHVGDVQTSFAIATQVPHRQSHRAEIITMEMRKAAHARELNIALNEEEGNVMGLSARRVNWSHLD